MKRRITIANGVADSHFAGYEGEHLATTLKFKLCDDFISNEYTYKLSIETADNKLYYALLNNDLEFALPQAVTIAGTLNVQLSILNNDKLIYKTSAISLNINQSISEPQTVVDSTLGLLDDTLAKFSKAVENVPDVTVEQNDSGVDITVTKNQVTDTFKVKNGKDYVITQSDIDNIITQTLNIIDGEEVYY